MSTTSMIPGAVIQRIREGAYDTARDVAHGIHRGAGREELLDARDRLAGVCALLDRIGWSELQLDVGEHAPTLTAVVGSLSPKMRARLVELSEDDPARSGHEQEYRLLREFQTRLDEAIAMTGTTRVPAAVVAHLREGLLSELYNIHEHLDALIIRPERSRRGKWAEPLARLDRVRPVLDLIGWEARDPEPDVELDLHQHRRVMETALSSELETMRDLADTDDDHQREWASKNVAVIEPFLAALESRP